MRNGSDKARRIKYNGRKKTMPASRTSLAERRAEAARAERRTPMKIFLYFGLLLILFGAFGFGYTYTADHRTAKSLSAYCKIDFQGSYDESGRVEGATLTMWDYRYSRAKPKPLVTISADGDAWDIDAIVKQQPPSYDLKEFDPDTSLKNTNKFFLNVSPQLLPLLRKADEVRVKIRYDNGYSVDLPLNEPDLAYWKAQLY